MLRLRLAAGFLAAACFTAPGIADDLTNEELLLLFQNQRDAFVAAQHSSMGQTRGLTLVTVEDVEVISLAPAGPEPANPELASPELAGAELAGAEPVNLAPQEPKLHIQESGPRPQNPDALALAPVPPELTTSAQDTAVIALPATDGGTVTVTDAIQLAEPLVDQTPELDAAPSQVQPVVFGALAPELQVNLSIEFAFDSATFKPDQIPVLTQMCTVMKLSDINLFRIVGHTDAAGTAEYNQTLSQLRAEEVQRFLVNDCGIDSTRVEAVGLGEQFLFDRQTPRAAANRRVEFQALS